MKKQLFGLIVTLMSVGALTGCGNEPDAIINDITAQSIYGQLSNFSAPKYKAGQTLTFAATPSQFYDVVSVTNNGVKCNKISQPDPTTGTVVFQTTLVAGENKLRGFYEIQPDVDIVDKFKMDIPKNVFDAVNTYSTTGDKYGLDFRRAGIERARAPMKFVGGQKVEDTDTFINYVDGDTTHVETLNLGYTVKIRYLSIDTPESTSEIEKWGLCASNFSKFLYSGKEEYLNNDVAKDELKLRPHGATSLILMSQGVAQKMAMDADGNKTPRDIDVSDLMIGNTTKEDGPFHATADTNQRSLAYVWYATVENPTINDYRCLNLEMVYQGFSIGTGSLESTSMYYYKTFNAAYDSAKANYRHLHSSLEDRNYFDYEDTTNYPINTLELSELYEDCLRLNPDPVNGDKFIKYDPNYSSYADKKTIRRVCGYVSAVTGTSFYLQDKYEYDQAKVISGEETPYGLYVFTFSQLPISVGDYVEAIGAISAYGGTFQMQGISFHDQPTPEQAVRDTKINPGDVPGGDPEKTYHEIVPIKLTGEQFNQLKLPFVLVEITDNLYFYNFQSVHNGKREGISEGGSEEVNKYNEHYPFYNTSNAPIVYASYGDSDNAATVNEEEITANAVKDPTTGQIKSSNGVRYSDRVIRFVVDQNTNVSMGLEKCYSYRFFIGGTYYYNPEGAEYANLDPNNPYLGKTQERIMTRKAHLPANTINHHGLVCMSQGYESTGGNRKMTAKFVFGSPDYVQFTAIV